MLASHLQFHLPWNTTTLLLPTLEYINLKQQSSLENPRTLPIMQAMTSCWRVLTILMLSSKEILSALPTLAFRPLRYGPKEIGISHWEKKNAEGGCHLEQDPWKRFHSLDTSGHLGRREWSPDHYGSMMGHLDQYWSAMAFPTPIPLPTLQPSPPHFVLVTQMNGS